MDTATTEIYTYCHTLSLHDALPISSNSVAPGNVPATPMADDPVAIRITRLFRPPTTVSLGEVSLPLTRSEEHTSELQSLMRISYAVFCLKKKKKNKIQHNM